MAGLPWFERDVDLTENKKVRALCARLREPLADAYVDRLYAYCYRQVTDRFEPDVAAETIERAVEWRGRRGVLFDALHACGILERDAGKVAVHGVAERLAPHVAKRLGDAVRQKRRRDRAAKSIGRPPDVTRDVTRESQRDKDKDKDKDKETEAALAPEPVRPIAAPAVARRLEVVDEGGGEVGLDPYPLTTRFRDGLATALARTAPHPVGGGAPVFVSCEAALERIPVGEAVALCASRVKDDVTAGRRPPKTLALFVQILGDELTRRASQPRAAPKCIGMDANGQPIIEGRP